MSNVHTQELEESLESLKIVCEDVRRQLAELVRLASPSQSQVFSSPPPVRVTTTGTGDEGEGV